MLRHARAGRVAAIALVAIVALSVVGPSPIGSTGDAEREARAIPMSMPPVTAGLRPPATVALFELSTSWNVPLAAARFPTSPRLKVCALEVRLNATIAPFAELTSSRSYT